MSVDAGHRYRFCKVLKTHFPYTQFVITTHDRLWAEQMKSAALVNGKTSLSFHSWTIDTGPLVESNVEIWQEIVTALGKGKVDAAAAALRHHLEYVARHLADQLGATPQFRADGNYELGELMPSVLALHALSPRLRGLRRFATQILHALKGCDDAQNGAVRLECADQCQWTVTTTRGPTSGRRTSSLSLPLIKSLSRLSAVRSVILGYTRHRVRTRSLCGARATLSI